MELPNESAAAIENHDAARAIRIVQDQTHLDYAAAQTLVEAYLARQGSPLVEFPPDAVQYLLAG